MFVTVLLLNIVFTFVANISASQYAVLWQVFADQPHVGCILEKNKKTKKKKKKKKHLARLMSRGYWR